MRHVVDLTLRLLGALVLLVALSGSAQAIRGREGSGLDSKLPTTVFSRYVVGGGGGEAGSIDALVRLRNTVYVGGLFSRVAERTGSAIVVPGTGGQHEPVRAEVAGGAVYAASADGSGGWYVGGSFTSVGGVPRPGLAHLRRDGTLDPAFSPAEVGQIRALALSGGTLYLGALRNRTPALQALDASTGDLLSVAYAVPRDATTVAALAARDGRLFAAFPVIGGVVAYDAASGARLWARAPLQGTEGTTGMAALALDGANLLVGGKFFDGANRNLEVLNSATGGAVGPTLTLDSPVQAIAVVQSTAYVTGPGVRAVDLATASVKQVTSIRDTRQLIAGGSTLYVTGRMTTKPPHPAPAQVYSLETGTSRAVLQPASPALPGNVAALAWQDGRLLVGGTFAGVGGAVRGGLAAFDVRTGALLRWRPTVDVYVTALAASGRTIYVGGLFEHVNGVKRQGLAAVGVDGPGRLLRWNPKMTSADVTSLVATHGRVFAGGLGFRSAKTKETAYLVAFSAGGTGAQLRFTPPVHSPVTALAAWHQALVVASDGILALPVTGNGRHLLWHRLTRNGPASGGVFALAVRGSILYAGGNFDLAAGQPRSHLAAFALDRRGALLPFAPGVKLMVRALAPSWDCIVFGGPDITSLSSGQALGAVSTQGTLEPWRVDTPSPMADSGVGTIAAIAAVPGGLVVGGSSTWLGPVGHQSAGGLAWIR
jgi:hypothetical protein